MARPKAEAAYYLVQFRDISDAAAFVAALSQFLSYPESIKYLRPSAPAEIWSYILGTAADIELIEVYLNATGLAAMKDSFDELPLFKTVRGDQLPLDCISLIGAGGVEAWGLEEAQWHLLSES
ncbi:MAG: hypothetical protein ABI970_25900 [Chloroflexota bacterium]